MGKSKQPWRKPSAIDKAREVIGVDSAAQAKKQEHYDDMFQTLESGAHRKAGAGPALRTRGSIDEFLDEMTAPDVPKHNPNASVITDRVLKLCKSNGMPPPGAIIPPDFCIDCGKTQTEPAPNIDFFQLGPKQYALAEAMGVKTGQIVCAQVCAKCQQAERDSFDSTKKTQIRVTHAEYGEISLHGLYLRKRQERMALHRLGYLKHAKESGNKQPFINYQES